MQKSVQLVLLIGLCLLGLLNGTAANAGEVIKIGLTQAVTTDAALIGIESKNGATMAIDDVNAAGGINGRPLEIVFADTAISDNVAVNAFNKVMASKPVAVIGTIWSTHAFATAPLINKANVPVLIGATNPRLTREASKWFFRIRPDDGITAAAATKFAVEQLKAKKVGIIYSDEQFGAGGAEIIINTLKGYNMEPAAKVTHALADKDVTSQLLGLQKAGCDAVIAYEGPAPMAIVIKQRRQLGINIPFITSPALGQPAVLKLLTDDEVNGIYSILDTVPDQNPDPKVQDWIKSFKAKFKVDAGPYAAEYYDGTMILLNAIKAVGTDSEALLKALRATNEYKGIANTYTSDKYGNATHSVVTVQFNKKAVKVLSTVSMQPER